MVGPRCPTCGSNETEMLLVIDRTADNECFKCGQFFQSAARADTMYSDPLKEWVATGDEI